MHINPTINNTYHAFNLYFIMSSTDTKRVTLSILYGVYCVWYMFRVWYPVIKCFGIYSVCGIPSCNVICKFALYIDDTMYIYTV